MKNQKSEPKLNEAVNAFQKAAPYLNIVYAFFGAIILFGYGGYLLDEWLGKAPWFLVSGVFTGFALGFYRMIKVVKELER